MAARAILITGATGKQGGSVVNSLLKQNAPFEILALTRDAQSSSSQKLLQKSSKIKLVTGNLDAPDDVFQKAKEVSKTPIWGVFSVQVPSKNEERQGSALVDAALKNGVKHFVYSSVDRGGANSENDPTNIPHFISKHNIEQHLFAKAKGSDMSWTVLRPVAFLENLTPNFFGKVFTTSWVLKLGEQQKKLQLVATSDIGFFAARAFSKSDSEQYQNRSISLAGDELTFDQFSKIFKEKTGETLPTTYHFIASVFCWAINELGYMFNWFRDVGYGADIAALKKENPDLKDFGTWLETESAWKRQ